MNGTEKLDKALSIAESIFGPSETKVRAKWQRVNPEPTLCIYFGHPRISQVRRRAEASRMTVSSYVCHMVDAADLGAANVEKLNLLAKLRGKSVSAVLAELLAEVG